MEELTPKQIEAIQEAVRGAISTDRTVAPQGTSRLEAAHRYAESSVKAVFLINGGAAVAMLVFIGRIFSTNQETAVEISWSLCFFSIGLISSTLATLVMYFAQVKFAQGEEEEKNEIQEEHRVHGVRLRNGAVFLIIVATILFLGGLLSALCALTLPVHDKCVGGVKGNISNVHGRMYFLPEMKNYKGIDIDINLGERWFCSEDEARKAGWRKSKSD